MKIVAESNCARKYRRLTSPMNVSIGGKIYALRNWSPAGMLVQTDNSVLVPDRIEEGELLVPCLDGLYMLPVQIQPLHFLSDGIGCKFVDMPPRERTLIHSYAEMVMRGEIGRIAQLEDCARIIPADEPPPPSIMEPDLPEWRRFLATPLFKRSAVVGGFAIVIALIAWLAIPFIMHGFDERNTAREDFLDRASARVNEEDSVLSIIDGKITNARSLLGANGKDNPTVSAELSRVLNDGVTKLLKERQVIAQRVESMKKTLKDAEEAAVFVPAAYEHIFMPDRPDPAPLLTKALNQAGKDDGAVVRSQTELDKYLLIARARVTQAETALESTRVKRETLERILKRVDDAGPQAGFPQNQLEIMRRDVALLQLEEKRLTDMVALLNDNVEAVKTGNLLYENKMLQRFDAQPNRAVGTAAESNLSD